MAASVASNLTQRGIEVLSAPGESAHLDFVANNITYEEQLQSAGKSYLDWYMLSQMEVLIMSKGGFSISAAHAGRPQRAMYLEGALGTCAFKDYVHECVGNVCPRQNSHTYPDAVEKEWIAGDY